MMCPCRPVPRCPGAARCRPVPSGAAGAVGAAGADVPSVPSVPPGAARCRPGAARCRQGCRRPVLTYCAYIVHIETARPRSIQTIQTDENIGTHMQFRLQISRVRPAPSPWSRAPDGGAKQPRATLNSRWRQLFVLVCCCQDCCTCSASGGAEGTTV